MGFNNDVKSAIDNLPDEKRQAVLDAFTEEYGLTKPNGDPLNTDNQKAQAAAEKLTDIVREVVTGHKRKIKQQQEAGEEFDLE